MHLAVGLMPESEFNATAGAAIVKAISDNGVTHVFCVPGESYLGVLDAFRDHASPVLVAARHEEGAGFMADAMAKMTGNTGVAMVSRGPGLTHLLIAVHGAEQDWTPLVVLVGQVPTGQRGRGAFQEVDVVTLGRTLGRDGLRIDRPEDAYPVMLKAFERATSWRPGPVLVEIPEDVANSKEVTRFFATAKPPPAPEPFDPDLCRAAAEALAAAQRPVLIVGEGVSEFDSTSSLSELAALVGAPVYSAWRRLDAFPNDDPSFGGGVPWLSGEMKVPLLEADVLVAIGTRLDEHTTLRYQLPGPSQRLIHIDSRPGVFESRPGSIEIEGDIGKVIGELIGLSGTMGTESELVAARIERVRRINALYLSSLHPPEGSTALGVVSPALAFAALRELLPADSVLVSDAGAFATYMNRYYRWTMPGTFLGTKSGAMGYAVPGGVGAKLAVGARPVIAVAGDGGFAMTMSEVHTAVRLGLSRLIFLVFDNGVLGTIARHQSIGYSRRSGVDSGSDDLVRIGEGMGAVGFRVDSLDGFRRAIELALESDVPAVVQVITDPGALNAWD